MILTGPAIAAARAAGDITIEPFDPERLNPNSYNFALGDGLRVYAEILDPDEGAPACGSGKCPGGSPRASRRPTAGSTKARAGPSPPARTSIENKSTDPA